MPLIAKLLWCLLSEQVLLAHSWLRHSQCPPNFSDHICPTEQIECTKCTVFRKHSLSTNLTISYHVHQLQYRHSQHHAVCVRHIGPLGIHCVQKNARPPKHFAIKSTNMRKFNKNFTHRDSENDILSKLQVSQKCALSLRTCQILNNTAGC